MAWVILIAFVASAAGGLWRFGGLPRSGLELLGAALLVGIAGYAWQGSPNQPGSPVISHEAKGKIDVAAITAQRAMRTQVGGDAQWLDLADALNRAGATQEAVLAIRSGLAQNRNSADLWVGLGNALVAHGDGLISPAAEFAFQHAASLSPDSPGPPFFFGLALAQQGQTAEARSIWGGLLARTPKDAPWRADLEARLAAIGGAPGKP